VKTGQAFPDLDLPDHTGRERRLSELAGGDPVAMFTSRGWWCPKEQRFMRELCRLQDELEVAYSRIVVLSVDPPEVQAAFRAGLGARFTLLSDAERRWLPRLGLLEAPTPSTTPTTRPASRCSRT
jgi:peroxiredoxin